MHNVHLGMSYLQKNLHLRKMAEVWGNDQTTAEDASQSSKERRGGVTTQVLPNMQHLRSGIKTRFRFLSEPPTIPRRRLRKKTNMKQQLGDLAFLSLVESLGVIYVILWIWLLIKK